MRTTIIILVGLLLAGCGTSMYEGEVINKRFEPAHDESSVERVYVGQSCTGGYGSQPQTCSPNYIWVPTTEHIPDAWFLHVEGCEREEESDPFKSNDCKERSRSWWEVSQSEYEAAYRGAWYSRESREVIDR